MGFDCIEHVWVLQGLVEQVDGRLSQRFGCERCPGVRLVGPEDEDPYSPDLPV